MATVLGDLVPEKRNALFARASVYAENRLVAGFHYRSDTVMSRTGAALIAQKWQSSRISRLNSTRQKPNCARSSG